MWQSNIELQRHKIAKLQGMDGPQIWMQTAKRKKNVASPTKNVG